MWRRCAIVVAVAGLALMAGCGSMILAVQEGEPIWLLHRVWRIVPEPSHQVALATLEVLKAELTDVKIVEEELSAEDRFNPPDGKPPKPDNVDIPVEYPAFWLDGLIFNESGPGIYNCRFCAFEGKTKDGRMVDAVVRMESEGSEKHSVVSLQVGRKGDKEASKALLDKIADRAAHPTLAPGSHEERAALSAAFLPRPGTEARKLVIRTK
jgi:hypothetical protein